MSSASKPVIDLVDESADAGSKVSELIFLLRSAFQQCDFDRVQQILVTREENLKRDVAKWRAEYEAMEKRQGELSLTKLEAEDELKRCKREAEVLQERITRLAEDGRVHTDREKRSEARYAKLLEEFSKAEKEKSELILRNSEMENAKRRAENEMEVYQKRFKELDLRLSRLEEDIWTLIRGYSSFSKRKWEDTHFGEEKGEKPASSELKIGEKKPCTSSSQIETETQVGIGDVGDRHAKESMSGRERVLNLGRSGSAFSSPEVGSSHPQEAGPCTKGKSFNKQKCEGGDFSNVMPASVIDSGRCSAGIIEIIDSDVDMPPTERKMDLHPYNDDDDDYKNLISQQRKSDDVNDTKNLISKERTRTADLFVNATGDSSSEDGSSSDSSIERLIAAIRKEKKNCKI